jgi:hypothetical protein
VSTLTLHESQELYDSMDPALEQRDGCDGEFAEALAKAVEADGGEPHPDWKSMHSRQTAGSVPHGGKVLKSIKGMGTIYDWRDSPWTQPSGGRIVPVIGVQHIPVIRNVDGFGDLITLEEVLQAQGLQVQQGTDREGNVALFTPGNFLCFQARGANQISWGTEHMHLTTSEAWTKRQLRAAAWVNQLNHKHYGTPLTRATLGAGNGLVRVLHRGQTTHKAVSHFAGYNDRSDPGVKGEDQGGGYDFEYVAHCEAFFAAHGHFAGA